MSLAAQGQALGALTGPAAAGSAIAVALDALHIHSTTETGCSTATMSLIKHAERNGLHFLDDMERDVCNGKHLDARQAATLQRLVTAARNTLQTLHRAEDDSGKWCSRVLHDAPCSSSPFFVFSVSENCIGILGTGVCTRAHMVKMFLIQGPRMSMQLCSCLRGLQPGLLTLRREPSQRNVTPSCGIAT
ncbi:hypothetical protein DUNSADRAFT_5343 [Dunaliella salina]|uniref:Uncharacterized protein n=1 Tax=Dunaliella salina TaxID=3046 RepID=A0ABQ7GQH7_DUNSA|nr:hypothetical protein DUNSADRAFT_5343 [Dunaliella salina]KAF5836852.1 hypothetical protein DUNSADRAFT_5343 [Dunaliella salina]|eukprot:KAF5836851.1 hypothetical protein DUNSADRAFT_5343 [Dunaliella salina]